MSSEINRRRMLLRGALAAGGALCLPVLARAGGSTPITLAEGKKVSKAVAKYQNKPNGNQMCANCQNFIAPNTCRVVEGQVAPNGWCTFWAKKAA